MKSTAYGYALFQKHDVFNHATLIGIVMQVFATPNNVMLFHDACARRVKVVPSRFVETNKGGV